eukprot:9800631-Karenia_brevis.AAC.1
MDVSRSRPLLTSFAVFGSLELLDSITRDVEVGERCKTVLIMFEFGLDDATRRVKAWRCIGSGQD